MISREIIRFSSIVCALALLLSPLSVFASDSDIGDEISNQLSGYDFSEWNSLLNDDSNGLFGDYNAADLVTEYVNGNSLFAPQGILDALLSFAKEQALRNIWWMLGVLAVSLLAGLSNVLLPDSKSGLREMVGFIACAMSVGAVTAVFSQACADAVKAVDAIANFCEASTPIISVMLVASGSPATGGVFSPMMGFLSGTVAGIVRSFVVPMILAGGVLSILSSLSDRVQLKQMQSLCKSTSKWSMGILTTLYMGIVSVQGLIAANHDGLSVKTARYIIDKSLPFAGGLVSGTVDTALYCARIVKEAAGLAAVVMVAIFIAAPLLKLACVSLALRVSASICEPVSDAHIPKLLSSLAETITYLFAAVAVVGAMFIISVGLTVCLYKA